MSVPTGNVNFMNREDQAEHLVAGSQRPALQLPETVERLPGAPELATAWEHHVAARRSEAAALISLLDYRHRLYAETSGKPLHYRGAARKAAVRDAALMLGLSEHTTTVRLNTAEFIRDHFPRAWGLFVEGALCWQRVRRVAEAAQSIWDQDQLVSVLDAELVSIAPEKNPAELKRWLARRVPELDAHAYEQQAAEAKAGRYVRIEHLPEGMSFLEALIPTVEAVSIQKRLSAAARSMDRPQPTDPRPDAQSDGQQDCQSPSGADQRALLVDAGTDQPVTAERSCGDQQDCADDRTLAQREADLFSAWLRDGRTYQAPNHAKICVLVPESTLSGETNQPAMGADRSWVIPAANARALAADPTAEHIWYTAEARKNTKQADHDILSVVYQGRFGPERLRDAVIFRDGVCQSPGCTSPAERTDLDHQIPHESGGPTNADNVWALCRRHHRMKSHGYLPVPAREPPNRHHYGPAA